MNLAIAILPLLSLLTCVVIPEHDSTHELLFHTGFGGSSISEKNATADNISGTDTGFAEKSTWESIVDGRWITNAFINYEAGDRSQRRATIEEDPMGGSNQILKFKIAEPHIVEGDHRKGRVSAVLETRELYEIRQSVRLYLHPDMANLESWDKKVDWLTLFEFWCTGNYRITISLHKEESVGEKLRFKASCGHKNLFGTFTEEWSEKNPSYEVLFGKWMTIDLAIKLGDPSSGNISMMASDDAHQDIPLFDCTRAFGNSQGFTIISPMKLYTSDRLIDFMKSNGWNLELCWDDWAFHGLPVMVRQAYQPACPGTPGRTAGY